jgi:hypothetical protein
MNIQQIRISRKLHIVSYFFFHRKYHKDCPRALEQLHDMFGKELYKLLEKSNFQPSLEDCKHMVQMIDNTIMTSAEITMRSQIKHQKCLDRFKNRLWILLEVIDRYSIHFYKISLW